MTTFCIVTLGCAQNQADSEYMSGLLKKAKFDFVETIEKADIVIFNTCTVKGPVENSFFRQLDELHEKYAYKIIIIAGCIPQADHEKLKKYSLVGTRQFHTIVQVVEEVLNNNILKMLEFNEVPSLKLPRVRKNSVVEIIPINLGCLGECSFCKVKQARGNLHSYSIEEIKGETVLALKDGVKEIWLTSQDAGCYGFDIGTNLIALLKELCTISGDFKIKIGMMNPEHASRIKEDLVHLFRSEKKIFKCLHIPLQSGSDYILEKMNRQYKLQEYMDLIQYLKLNIPELNLITDIIVGFPSETDQDNWQTQTVLRKISPDVVNISPFWPRSKTPAAKLRMLPGEQIKRRLKITTELINNISRLQNERWLGWVGEILIDGKGELEKQWIGRNVAYKSVIVEGDYTLGQVLKVKIENVNSSDLKGKVVK